MPSKTVECEACFKEVPKDEIRMEHPGGPRNNALEPVALCEDCQTPGYDQMPGPYTKLP